MGCISCHAVKSQAGNTICLVMYRQAICSNRGAVKEQYEALRHLLRTELGVEPAVETQKCYQQLLERY